MIVTNPFGAGSWDREHVDTLSRGWWALLVAGVISVIAGGIILFTSWTVNGLADFLGLVLMLRGLVTMLTLPIDGAARSWSAALGLCEFAVGGCVWVWPGPTLLVLAVLIGWWVLLSGLMAIVGGLNGRGVLPYWGITLAFGIVETILAFWLLARPGLTLVAAVMAIGLWCMVYGVVHIVLAFEAKNLPRRFPGTAHVDLTGSGRTFDSDDDFIAGRRAAPDRG